MKCPKCGKTESDIALSYCTECGTPLDEEITLVANYKPVIQIPPSIQPVPASRGINPLFAILPTTILLMLITGAVVYWLKTETPATNGNVSQPKPTESIVNKPSVDNQSTLANSSIINSNASKNGGIKQFRVMENVKLKGDNFLSLRSDPRIKNNNLIIEMPIGSIVEVDSSKTVRPDKVAWCYITKYFDNETKRQYHGWASSEHLEKFPPD